MKKLILQAFIAFALVIGARAQSVQQSGNVTPGHASCFATTGVIYDCGVVTGSSILGSYTANDFLAANGSGSIVDSGISAVNTSSITALWNFNGGATGPTRPSSDDTTYFATTAFVQSAVTSPILTPPNWGTFNSLYQGGLYDLGGLPTSSMDAHNSGAIAMTQALVGAVDVPGTPNASNTFQNDGVAGYARTALPNAPAVGVFGGGMANVAGAMVWGFNSICTNANQIEPLTQTGFTNVTCYGAEFDVNILKLPGGGTPTGNVRGMSIFGGSEVKPSGGAYGIEIGSLSQTYVSTVAWDAALVIDEAPNTIGIAIGAKGTGTTSLSSQNLVFNAYSSGSALLQADILEDDAGDFIFTPGGGGFIALENSSGIPILGVFSSYIVAYEPLEFAGSSAGTMTSQVPSSFTSYNWNYPATAGTSGYVLTSGGGTTNLMTWTQISGIYAPLAGTNTFTGVNTFSNTTPATSTTTGAIVTAGGIGVAKSSFFGDTIQIETGTQYHGFALSNASNQVVTFNGLSASNDNGNMELLSGGVGTVNFSADPSVANYINNGQGLTLGATSAAGAGNLKATGTGQFAGVIATAVAPTVTTGQIGYGSTVVAAGADTCPSGTVGGQSVAGCIVVNIAGTAHYAPYF